MGLNRREMIRTSALGAAWLASLGIPEQVWALQDGEELVTFTDYTEAFQVEASPANTRVRCFDLRRLTTWTTPNDEFYAFAQTTTQKVDAASYRLHISGFIDKPRELTLAEVMARPDRREIPVTLECSGNSTRPNRMSGLLSNGVWTGIGLAALLNDCGVRAEAREVVFLGLDMATEKKAVSGRQVEVPHGRSIYVQDALNPEAMLAFALNGQPLPAEQGFPLRLILPGWYGMTQIKWLGRIHVLDRRYEGQHMTRNYLAIRGVDTPGGPLWLDTSISKTNMKSVVARVTRRCIGSGAEFRITGPAWGGPVPIAQVDVQIDDGAWQRATLEPSRGPYAWRLWSLAVKDLAPGPHRVHSRATDANGMMQPTAEERRKRLAGGREDFSIWTREITV
jgi:DMSO/TMAO reductase YedYZ molybdopterin-dependent catalytic subunit